MSRDKQKWALLDTCFFVLLLLTACTPVPEGRVALVHEFDDMNGVVKFHVNDEKLSIANRYGYKFYAVLSEYIEVQGKPAFCDQEYVREDPMEGAIELGEVGSVRYENSDDKLIVWLDGSRARLQCNVQSGTVILRVNFYYRPNSAISDGDDLLPLLIPLHLTNKEGRR